MAPPYVNGGTTAATIAKSNAPRKVAIPDLPPAKKRPVPTRPVDPYANPQAYIRQAVARLGAPLTDAQIQSQAQGMLSPLVQALTSSIGRQAQAGTQAIGGYTSNLQHQFAPFEQSAADIYGGAQASQAASDAALSAKLQGEGGQQAAELGARLASINAPGATGQAVQGAAQTATGAGNALYATGSASLADLIAQGAAEKSYASKLPGIAGLAGLQQTGQLQGKLAASLADQTGQLQAKVPDIVSGLQGQRSDLLGRRETLRQDLQGFFSDRDAKQQALKQEAAAFGLKQTTAAQSLGLKKNDQAWKRQYDAARLKISQQTADASTARAQLAAWKATHPQPKPKAPPKVQTTLSAANHYLTDSSGNPILKKGKRQPYTPASSASSTKKPLTVPQKEKATADAYGIARNGLAGVDGEGNKAAKLNVGQAWDQMKLHGLLSDPRTKALAIKALVETYGAAGARFVRKQGIAP